MRKKIFFGIAILMALAFTGASCITRSSSTMGPKGVFKSLDKGDSWEAASALPTAEGVGSIANINMYRLFDDPSDSDAYYLGSRGQGLFFTYDRGRSWQIVDDPAVADKFIYGLVVDPENKCIIYATDGAHIYKTEDCSRSWELMFTEQRIDQYFTALAIERNSGAIYGLQYGGDLLKSSDQGKSWQVIKRFSMHSKDITDDPRMPGRLYVATEGNGLYRSDDEGANWINLNEDLAEFDDSKRFYRLVLNPSQDDSLFWISKYGILRSDDAGNSWTDLKLLTPPGSVSIFAFAVNPKNQEELYYTGTILDDKNQPVKSTFYKSTDGGLTWVTKKLPTNTIPVLLKVHPDDENELFAGFTLL